MTYFFRARNWCIVYRKFFLILMLTFVGSFSALGAEPAPIGSVAPDLRFKDRWFLSRSLSELKYRAVVLFALDSTCPLAKRLIPYLNRLQEQVFAQQKDVLVLGAFIDPHESTQAIQDFAFRHKVEFPVVKLTAGPGGSALGESLNTLGLDRLASVVLLGEGKEILYRGRMTDEVRLTGTVPGGRPHLQLALEAYLEGRVIERTEVEGEGCIIEIEPEAKIVDKDVTWKQVAPIFQQHCVSCHRAGGGGPFSLDTYEAVSRKARTILRVISEGQMPPWYANADSPFPFMNENRLSGQEKQQISDWVKLGAPGNGGETLGSSVPEFPVPDQIFTSREIKVPASGIIPYLNIPLLKSLSNEERWVAAIRIVPTNPRVVHHANLAYLRGADIVSGVPNKNFIIGYVPGVSPMILEPGVALKIPAKSLLGLQVHVVTTGVEETTRIRVEIKYTTEVKRRLRFHMFDIEKFSIPPGHPYYPLKEEWITPRDIELVGAFAHMHYRGKDYHLTVQEGDKNSSLLAIPNYHFDWQMGYQWPVEKIYVGQGSRFTAQAHYDNSRFNVLNPNPLATVQYGEQSDDEMMLGLVYYLLKVEDLSLEL